MTTVGQAGAKIGIPPQAVTIARRPVHGLLYRPFGKNHLGDLNEFLPTVHGFDEFFGYLITSTRWKTRHPVIRRNC